MIESDLELKQSIEQLERMYRVLLEFRRRILPLNYKNYQVFAEGPLEEIKRLQHDIDEYLAKEERPTATAAGA
jgi:hypothetical protein